MNFLYRTKIGKLIEDCIDNTIFINQSEDRTPLGTFVIISLSVRAANEEKAIMRTTHNSPISGEERIKELRKDAAKKVETLKAYFEKYGYVVETDSGFLPCKASFDALFQGDNVIDFLKDKEVVEPPKKEETAGAENTAKTKTSKKETNK